MVKAPQSGIATPPVPTRRAKQGSTHQDIKVYLMLASIVLARDRSTRDRQTHAFHKEVYSTYLVMAEEIAIRPVDQE